MSPRPLAWLTPWLLILPAALASAVLFVAPVGYLAIESLRSFSLSAGPGKDFVLTNYRRLLTDPYYLDVLYRTFELSAAASVICLVLGYPLAMLLRAAPARAKGWLVIGIIAPLLISVIVRTFGWVVILGEFGLLNSALKALGFTGSFSKSSHLFTAWTVVIGLVHVFLPFMVLSIYSALQKQRPGIAQAARSLGASQLRAFWHVTLPLSLPASSPGSRWCSRSPPAPTSRPRCSAARASC